MGELWDVSAYRQPALFKNEGVKRPRGGIVVATSSQGSMRKRPFHASVPRYVRRTKRGDELTNECERARYVRRSKCFDDHTSIVLQA